MSQRVLLPVWRKFDANKSDVSQGSQIALRSTNLKRRSAPSAASHNAAAKAAATDLSMHTTPTRKVTNRTESTRPPAHKCSMTRARITPRTLKERAQTRPSKPTAKICPEHRVVGRPGSGSDKVRMRARSLANARLVPRQRNQGRFSRTGSCTISSSRPRDPQSIEHIHAQLRFNNKEPFIDSASCFGRGVTTLTPLVALIGSRCLETELDSLREWYLGGAPKKSRESRTVLCACKITELNPWGHQKKKGDRNC